MTVAGSPLRILLSAAARARLAQRIDQVLAGRPHRLLTVDHAEAAQADLAFVSRDVTGLSTKHRVLPATQAFHDALRRAAGLRWLQVHSAGADRPVYLELAARGVQVATSSGANAPVVAQTAVLGLLALARHWPLLLAAQREHRWAHLMGSGLPRDLQGQVAVIVGWGPVGQEIGRLLQAIGLQVVVVRRTPAPVPGLAVVADTHLHEVLPMADWLLLACPLTVRTRGLVGAAALARLPSHARLVNISRGDVVDEAALVEALLAGRLGGAYLDVYAEEPLPADSPLWDLPNVIATPHSAGLSDANEARVDDMFLANLGRWGRGEPLADRLLTNADSQTSWPSASP